MSIFKLIVLIAGITVAVLSLHFASPDAADATASSQSQTLCLDVGSTPAYNVRLHRSASKARRAPERQQVWTDLGGAWLEHVHTYAASGDLLNVLACAGAAEEIESASLAAAELRASVQLSSHDFSEALRLADAVIASDPSRIAAWGVKADAHLERGEWTAATQATQAAMRLWPGAPSHARTAYLHWLGGDAEAAKRSLVEALRGRDGEAPGFEAWLWTEVALIYWHEGDLADAERLFDHALVQVPDYPPALMGRARIALARRDYPVARQFSEHARRAGAPFEAEILGGDIAFLAESAAAAEPFYARAERLGRRADPVSLARFLAERNRNPQRALRLLGTVEPSRMGISVREARAWANLHSDQCPRAKAELQPLIELGTREAKQWLLAGAIERTCGDQERGRQWTRKALALNPAVDPLLLTELHIPLPAKGET